MNDRAGAPRRIEFTGDIGPGARVRSGGLVATYCVGSRQREAKTPGQAQGLWMRRSGDEGLTWSEGRRVLELEPTPGAVITGMTMVDGAGRAHAFWLRFYQFDWQTHDPAKCRSELWHASSEDEGETWSEAGQVDFGHSYTGAVNSSIALASGRILTPVSYLSGRATGKFVSTAAYSDDGGRTWERCRNDVAMETGGGAPESGTCEPVVVELADGRVWMNMRTQSGHLFESYSRDGGETWSGAKETQFRSSNAPAGVLRLRDGRIVLAWNRCWGEPFWDGVSYARQALHGAISEDGGKTWLGPVELARKAEEEPIKSQRAYPFMCETAGGKVVMLYHRAYSRAGEEWAPPTRLLMRFDPDWLAEEGRSGGDF